MQSLSALAGELSAPGLLDLDTQHRAYPFPENELRQMQDEILDTAWGQALQDLSNSLDPEPAPAMQEQLVRICVEWDMCDAPYGVSTPNRYVLIPQDVWEEGVRDEEIVEDWLFEKYSWPVETWFTA